MYLRQSGPLLRDYEDETDQFLRTLDEHPDSQSLNRQKEVRDYTALFLARDYPTGPKPKRRIWEDIEK